MTPQSMTECGTLDELTRKPLFFSINPHISYSAPNWTMMDTFLEREGMSRIWGRQGQVQPELQPFMVQVTLTLRHSRWGEQSVAPTHPLPRAAPTRYHQECASDCHDSRAAPSQGSSLQQYTWNQISHLLIFTLDFSNKYSLSRFS